MKITVTIQCKDEKLLDAIESLERMESSSSYQANELINEIFEEIKITISKRLNKKFLHLIKQKEFTE